MNGPQYGSARIIVGDVGVAKATRRSMVRGMRSWNFVTFLSKVEKHSPDAPARGSAGGTTNAGFWRKYVRWCINLRSVSRAPDAGGSASG